LVPKIVSSGQDTFHWFRVVVQSVTSNRFGALSQILQLESVINSWIATPTSETLQNSCNDKDSPVKKEIKLCIHQLHQIQHNHKALYTSTLHLMQIPKHFALLQHHPHSHQSAVLMNDEPLQ
jgi:hypothetical protein